MTIDNGPSRKRVRVIETFALGLLYLFLVTSFFGVAAYLTGWDANRSRPEGFVGRSTTVDLTSGVLSFAIMSGAVWALRGCKIVYNIVLCFAASALVAAADFFSVMAFFRMFHADEGINLSLECNAEDMFICWMMYLGWCCATQMLLFYFDVQDREHRLAVAREEALAAQMQALRYQVNPHFPFNTLNSIAGLIEEGAPTQVERMVLSLSTFLRTTLALDPLHDVPLADEFALQEEYLGIEPERFSDRMAFQIDISEDARQASRAEPHPTALDRKRHQARCRRHDRQGGNSAAGAQAREPDPDYRRKRHSYCRRQSQKPAGMGIRPAQCC